MGRKRKVPLEDVGITRSSNRVKEDVFGSLRDLESEQIDDMLRPVEIVRNDNTGNREFELQTNQRIMNSYNVLKKVEEITKENLLLQMKLEFANGKIEVFEKMMTKNNAK